MNKLELTALEKADLELLVCYEMSEVLTEEENSKLECYLKEYEGAEKFRQEIYDSFPAGHLAYTKTEAFKNHLRNLQDKTIERIIRIEQANYWRYILHLILLAFILGLCAFYSFPINL
jgi:hypothetical protein